MATVKGVIGISGGELARYAIFYDSLIHVGTPPETALIQARGANIAENRNGITEFALSAGADWIWYVDDDHVFHPQTLQVLLAHDVDIVSGLYVSRVIPFVPHVYDREDDLGRVTRRILQPFEGGLKPVLATGAGCLLVKTKVIRSLDAPYWTLGQLDKVSWSDDIDFCRRARAKGFSVWCDLDVVVGHQMGGTLWPTKEKDGEWVTKLIQGRETIATWPAAQPVSSLITPVTSLEQVS